MIKYVNIEGGKGGPKKQGKKGELKVCCLGPLSKKMGGEAHEVQDK